MRGDDTRVQSGEVYLEILLNKARDLVTGQSKAI